MELSSKSLALLCATTTVSLFSFPIVLLVLQYPEDAKILFSFTGLLIFFGFSIVSLITSLTIIAYIATDGQPIKFLGEMFGQSR